MAHLVKKKIWRLGTRDQFMSFAKKWKMWLKDDLIIYEELKISLIHMV